MPDTAARGYKPIPVAEAERLSMLYGKSEVVILVYDTASQMTHITTFGKSAFDKENAAAAGEKCGHAIGADLSRKQVWEDFHNDYDPALFKECLDLLGKFRLEPYCKSELIQQAEKILKAKKEGVMPP
jgi:hypothetical protein